MAAVDDDVRYLREYGEEEGGSVLNVDVDARDDDGPARDVEGAGIAFASRVAARFFNRGGAEDELVVREAPRRGAGCT